MSLTAPKKALKDRLHVHRIESLAAREGALEVLTSVFCGEKGWIDDLEEFFPENDLEREQVSWFLATVDDQPVGVMRVLYEIPFDLYMDYGFEMSDSGFDVEAFVRNNRIAEIGRFAIIPQYRKRILVATLLMRAAVIDTMDRDYTHFITDVFENDPNTPLEFHQRILGFKPVATHHIGELNHVGRRITLLVDVKEQLRRLYNCNNWIFRIISQGWKERLVHQISA